VKSGISELEKWIANAKEEVHHVIYPLVASYIDAINDLKFCECSLQEHLGTS
jgi:hypothetical protein